MISLSSGVRRYFRIVPAYLRQWDFSRPHKRISERRKEADLYIGYDNAAKTAKKAHAEYISLKEACVSLGFLTAERFDEVFHPEEMV